MRKIPKARIRKHDPIVIETCREHGDPAFEIEIDRDPGRACIPIIAVIILESVSMPGSRDKTSRLVRNGIVWRIGERSERAVADISAVGVNIVFGARRGVL